MIRIYITTFLLVLTTLPSYSCSCEVQSFENAKEQADEIFIGRLIELKEVTYDNYEPGDTRTNMWSATFEVEKKWKGNSDKYVTIYQSRGSCDFPFDFPSYPYLVYASYGDSGHWYITGVADILYTWLCTRTASANVYLGWDENSWGDDRPLLDKAYPTPIKLKSKTVERVIWIVGALLILWVILWIIRNKKPTPTL